MVYVFCFALSIRLVSLFVSIAHEKKLKASGAEEFGKINTRILTIAHTLYYAACLCEGLYLGNSLDLVSWIGLGVFFLSMLFLFLVIRQLGPLWTVKLIIAPKHKLNDTFLFRTVKHPNYFLNIIPELVAVAMICQAWHVLLIGLPIYLIPLNIRISQEEKVMKKLFSDY